MSRIIGGLIQPFYLYSFVFFIILIIFCEYFVYYIVLAQCSWPELNKDHKLGINENDKPIRAVFIADIHILGNRKAHWADKLRREWQMYRSFQTILQLHKPQVVFILGMCTSSRNVLSYNHLIRHIPIGDVIDEGSFSDDELYSNYVKRFFHLFHTGSDTKVYVVAGNHDIGFHYAMHPYLEHRFSKTFKAPSVKLVTKNNKHFILLNSMAMENDGCNICNHAMARLEDISNKLRCANGTGPCTTGVKKIKFSRPILLQHFPLYRESDAHCNEPDEAPSSEKNVKFKEKWDCLSKEATEFLLEKLQPRLVFSGHTHHGCHTVHKNNIHEYTIPSFNWRNKPNPSFSLAVFTEDDFAITKCYLPHEYFVIGLYIVALLVNLVYFVKTSGRWN